MIPPARPALGPALALILAAGLGGAALAQPFTTSAEVKPILDMTRAHWLALSAQPGQDLLYFTQIESWRCGITQIRYSINSPDMTAIREVESCYLGTNAPNALRMEGHVPYVVLPAGVLESVAVVLFFDDGSHLTETYRRDQILMP